VSPHPKITPQAHAKLVGREADEPVTLRLRTTGPLATEQITVLTTWGGRLLYDNGIMAVLVVPAIRVEDIAGWDVVLEVV
jgi:hypothetical protein